VTYTPNLGFVGADSFTYTISVAECWASSAASVSVVTTLGNTVLAVPVTVR
jgi:hypothetical protein